MSAGFLTDTMRRLPHPHYRKQKKDLQEPFEAAKVQGVIQQYAEPNELLRKPGTDFVKQLADKERRSCHLPDGRLNECEYSGIKGHIKN